MIEAYGLKLGDKVRYIGKHPIVLDMDGYPFNMRLVRSGKVVHFHSANNGLVMVAYKKPWFVGYFHKSLLTLVNE